MEPEYNAIHIFFKHWAIHLLVQTYLFILFIFILYFYNFWESYEIFLKGWFDLIDFLLFLLGR